MTQPLTQIIQELAERYSARFVAQSSGARTVGREAEFPIVDAQGRAVDARILWQDLERPGFTPKYEPGAPGRSQFIVGLNGPDYAYALEVGLGTVEIVTRPCRHLFEIEQLLIQAVAPLIRAAAGRGWRVLGYGIQPSSPPTLQLMSPKQRYLSLYRAMGTPWLWYTITASDQLHVSITRGETLTLLHLGSLLTPVVIALCGNSPIFGGRLSQYCSAREGKMAAIYHNEHRHGMHPRPFSDLDDYIGLVAESTHLILQDSDEVIPSSAPFSDYLAEHGPDLDAFLYHEHYTWNSARLRAAYSTIELRAACQQPWSERMAANALELGLIEGWRDVWDYLEEEFADDLWPRMHLYHAQAIRFGLEATQPAPSYLSNLLDIASAALTRRGFGEETLLSPCTRRLSRRRNPAQEIATVFGRDGLYGLIRRAAIYPS